MRKLLLSAAATTVLAASTAFAQTPAPAAPAAPASPLSFNVGVTSNYVFRGISQTHGKPAIQGGIDYLHPSGFYVGAWASSITWVKDAYGKVGTRGLVRKGMRQAVKQAWRSIAALD